MSAPWLTIIGMGEDGPAGLGAEARRALESAELVIASKRLLALMPDLAVERRQWPSPFTPLIDDLLANRHRHVVVVASGDPLNYGVARRILARIPVAEARVIPAVSSLSLTAARMGWSLPDCDTLTVHGRSPANVEPFIQPGARLILLTDGDESVREVARRLVERGFGTSPMTALESLGGGAEKRIDFTAANVPQDPFGDLLSLAIHCEAGPGARILARTPGLPDDAFEHDGQITKREVRAATIAALAPAPDQLLWDVGAGSGSISIEWMRSKILERVPIAEVRILPAVSSLSLAAARMGWSLPDCDTLTVHGRSPANVEPFIQPGARLILLTDGDESVREVARRLVERGFGASPMTALESLGGGAEKRIDFTAATVPQEPFGDLLSLAIHCEAGPAAHILARTPGLPEDAFEHDGQITKREVRAATIAALAPAPDQLLWDVGAGSGSISIEWMRSTRGARAIAFERHPGRLEAIARNADRLGTPRLEIVAGPVPATLAGKPQPDAVFLGGAVADDDVFATAWAALKPGGRLVANAVTLEGEARLIARQAAHGGDLVRMSMEDLTVIGGRHVLRPRMAVLQWRVMK